MFLLLLSFYFIRRSPYKFIGKVNLISYFKLLIKLFDIFNYQEEPTELFIKLINFLLTDFLIIFVIILTFNLMKTMVKNELIIFLLIILNIYLLLKS